MTTRFDSAYLFRGDTVLRIVAETALCVLIIPCSRKVIGDETLMGFGRMKLNQSMESPMTSAGGAAPSPAAVRRSVAAGKAAARGSPGVECIE